MQVKRCNNLPRTLALYLINAKVKKRIIDVLSSFNVIVSYTIAQNIKKRLLSLNVKEIRT